MTDLTKQFNDTLELLAKVIIPKRYRCISLCDFNPEYDKLKRLTNLIINAKRKENPIPMLKSFDNIILPFKDINFDFCKSNNSVYVGCIYDAIDEIKNPKGVFKYINASIHLKLLEKYDARTISCIILDVMIYCIINNIEINVIDLVWLNWNLLLKHKGEYPGKWPLTKNILKQAMPDGYMKDIILKAIEQEEGTREIEYTYSIVDIVEKLRLN